MSYLTMGRLTVTENLGSQMGNLASLYAITRKTGHQIVFFDDWVPPVQVKKYRKLHKRVAARIRDWIRKLKKKYGKVSNPPVIGLMINIPFVDLPIIVRSQTTLTESESLLETFVLDQTVVVDSRIFMLDPIINYNIEGLFHSYRYWYFMQNEIVGIFKFKEELLNDSMKYIAGLKVDGSELVSVHVRRGDYLDSPFHLNLQTAYYENAFSLFDDDKYKFLMFSDDLEWCKTTFSCEKNIVYSDNNSPYFDMCSMSLCDHNIIANSSFSFWGAILNKNISKRVICPARFLLKHDYLKYFNYNWYPDNWVSLDV